MNNLKNTLAKQLETIGLSEERKKIIAEKAKKQQASSHKKGQWAYRVILSVVALLAVSFTYLLLKNDSFQLSANSAATEETNIQTLLMNSDGVKIGILAVVFMITYSMLAWRKRLNYWVLPHCIYCQEDWTYRQSLKRIWGSYKTTCPHCGEVQYQTKATMRRMDYFNLSLPLIIVIALLFNNVWLGASVYILSILFMMSRFGPYLMTFQHEKASLNRLLKFVQVAIIMLVVTSTLIMADEALIMGATEHEVNYTLFKQPFIQYGLLIISFLVIGFIVNLIYKKNGKELPVCTECNKSWTFSKALKISLKGNKVTCSYCGTKQYKTRKSIQQLNYFTLAIPFGIIVAQIPWFTNALLSYVLYTVCIIILMVYFAPYTIKLQHDDPMKKPWY